MTDRQAAMTMALFLFLALPFCLGSQTAPEKPADLAALLPSLEGWSLSEAVQNFLPDTLFEYIDGAAESYLAYNFQGLVVGQYKKDGAPSQELTVEIYDLGSPRNAFGIYSMERYPESQFLQLGVQGYKEPKKNLTRLLFEIGNCMIHFYLSNQAHTFK